jgi:hypothetical protein
MWLCFHVIDEYITKATLQSFYHDESLNLKNGHYEPNYLLTYFMGTCEQPTLS